MPRRLSAARRQQVQRLHLDVSTDHALLGKTPALTTWHVTAYVEAEESEGEDEDMSSAPPVGIATIVTCNMQSGQLWEQLTDQGEDLITIAEAIIDPRTGRYRLDVLPGAQGDLIIGKEVFVTLKWRGYGLGLLILAESISLLGQGFGVAVVHPAPTGLVDLTKPQRAHGVRKLQTLWSELGFTHAAGEVFALKLSSPSLQQKRAKLRKHFGLDP